jgi:hypothetical protein
MHLVCTLLNNKEPHSLGASPNTVIGTISRRLRRDGHVARTEGTLKRNGKKAYVDEKCKTKHQMPGNEDVSIA